MTALCCALIPFIAGALILGGVLRGRAAIVALVLASFLDLLLATYSAWQREPGSSEFLLAHYFVIDASSTLFLSLIAMIFFGICNYMAYRLTVHIFSRVDNPDNYCGRALLFFAACVLAVLSNHLIGMWVFLELSTVAIAPMIFARKNVRRRLVRDQQRVRKSFVVSDVWEH